MWVSELPIKPREVAPCTVPLFVAVLNVVHVPLSSMASPYQDPGLSEKPYHDPTPMPTSVPHVEELGTTSAPLKSAAFFIGVYCKDFNGASFPLCVRVRAEKADALVNTCFRQMTSCFARPKPRVEIPNTA